MKSKSTWLLVTAAVLVGALIAYNHLGNKVESLVQSVIVQATSSSEPAKPEKSFQKVMEDSTTLVSRHLDELAKSDPSAYWDEINKRFDKMALALGQAILQTGVNKDGLSDGYAMTSVTKLIVLGGKYSSDNYKAPQYGSTPSTSWTYQLFGCGELKNFYSGDSLGEQCFGVLTDCKLSSNHEVTCEALPRRYPNGRQKYSEEMRSSELDGFDQDTRRVK
jgi:hypothetical protein